MPPAALRPALLSRIHTLLHPGRSDAAARTLATAAIGILSVFVAPGGHVCGAQMQGGAGGKDTPRVAEANTARYLQAPLSFEANQGQADAKVRFLSRGSGYALSLTDTAAILTLHKPGSHARQQPRSRVFHPQAKGNPAAAGSTETDVVRMEIAGARPAASITGTTPLEAVTNYFIGNDPSRWTRKVPNYAGVRYTGIYPGVDLVYYGNQRQLEYDFIVAPQADPNQVKLHFAGARQLKLDPDGKLRVLTNNGEIALHKPVVYQDAEGRRQPVDGRFTLLAGQTVTFTVGPYDRSRALVIDPTLSYSTYLGGSAGDAGLAIAADSNGGIYVTGYTSDTDFPVTSGALNTTNTSSNQVSFVARLNAAGSQVYTTYLGGTSTPSVGDFASGIAIDAAGNAYVTGQTYGNSFPVTTGAFQATNKAFAKNAENAFVSKLSADGSTLLYSTYLGGSGLTVTTNGFSETFGDTPLRIAVDGSGNAYVTGSASSTDFPVTSGAYQRTNRAAPKNGSNAFVTKLSADGKSLVYSTYLGGTGITNPATTAFGTTDNGDGGAGIAIDSSGNAYIAGSAFSTDFPTTGSSYQAANRAAANHQSNAFVATLDATGSTLLHSTYLGGTGIASSSSNYINILGDNGYGIALDGAGNAYVTGAALSGDFPVSTGAFQSTNRAAANSSTNTFVTKLNPALTSLVYSTYVGGSGFISSTASSISFGDLAYGIAVNPAGNAFIAGATYSTDFPVSSGAYQSTNKVASGSAGYLTELSTDGTSLVYSTYLGGSGAGYYGNVPSVGDFAYSVALDSSGNIYETGLAYSYDFPLTRDALQTQNRAGGQPGSNVFIARFGATAGTAFFPTTTTLVSSANPQVQGSSVTFTAHVKGTAGVPAPTGTVAFYVDGTRSQTADLDGNGNATYTTATLSQALNNVIAAYSGDSVNGASGISLGQNVSQPAGNAYQLAFITPPAPVIAQGGNGGTAIVAVEDAAGNIFTGATGAVTLTISGPTGFTPLTLIQTPVNGIATFDLANSPLGQAGLYIYAATQAGLVSAFASEIVTPYISAISPNVVSTYGQAFTLNLFGNFTGYLNSSAYAVCTLSPNGQVNPTSFTGSAITLSTTIPASVIRNSGITEVYIGDSACGTQYSNQVPLDVQTANVTSLTITPATVAYGKPVTFTATVLLQIPPPNTFIPYLSVGQVVFCEATAPVCNSQTNLGTAQLTSNKTATLSIIPGTVGVHSYKAVYIPTTYAAPSTSTAQSVTVTGTYPTTTDIAAAGSAGNYTLTGTVNGIGTLDFTPAGTVSFLDQTNGGTVIGSAALAAASASQTFVEPSTSPAVVGTNPYSVTTGDFNGDGVADAAVVNYTDNTISVLIGKGDGSFQPAVSYNVQRQPERIDSADVNGDGKLDLLIANTASGTISVLLGIGDGTFQAQQIASTVFGTASLVVADFNRDGNLDIAVSDFYNANIGILLGNGDGTFQDVVFYPAGNSPRTLTFGDFNQDGYLDLAVANEADNNISILAGNGDGTFRTQVKYPTGTAPEGLVAADFNGDGTLDLVVANSQDNNVGLLIGNGDGSFQAQTTYPTGANPLEPAVADFNGDGKLDVAVENFNDATESILIGNGDGTLRAGPTLLTGANPYGVAVADFNGDGYPDLILSNFNSNNETILLDRISSTAVATLPNASVTGPGTSHQAIAQYPGDLHFNGSASSGISLMPASLISTTLSIAALPATSTVGQTVTFTATLAPFTSGTFTTNGETVNFFATGATGGTTVIGSGSLINGVATLIYSGLPAGTTAVKAIYGGDTNFAASTSADLNYTVTAAATQLVFTTRPAPAIAPGGNGGTAVVAFEDATGATVTSASGTVTLTITGPAGYTAQTLTANAANGLATFNLANTPLTIPGTYTYTATSPSLASATATETVVAILSAFPAQDVGTTSATAFVPVLISKGATLANVKVVTQGLTGYDFNAVSVSANGLCSTGNAYTAGAICNVPVSFAPIAVGQRVGAVLLYDNTAPNPVLLGKTLLSGIGNGPLVTVTPGLITAIAGNGKAGFSGDGGPATGAQFKIPDAVTQDPKGNTFIADTENNRIRKVDAATGIITTIAGSGTQGFSGDGGPAVDAALFYPTSVAIDALGDIYFSDQFNHSVRKITTATGIISTFAGNEIGGSSGDGGPASSAQLGSPEGIGFDSQHNLYIADGGFDNIRRVDGSTGIISTVAGNGTRGFAGDGGAATAAELRIPYDVQVDANGNIFIADAGNSRIRRIDAITGIITTVGGTGSSSSDGNGGPATSASFVSGGSTLDPAADLYIADYANSNVRRIDAATGVIYPVAGGGGSTGNDGVGDGGPAIGATLTSLRVFFGAAGDLLVPDTQNNYVHLVTATGAPVTFPATNNGTPSAAQTIVVSNTGNTALTVSSITIAGTNPADFAQTNTCGTSIAVGASCNVTITFTPTGGGARAANLVITDNNINQTGATQTVALSGQGNLVPVITSLSPSTTTAQGPAFTLTINGSNFVVGDTVSVSAVNSTTPGPAELATFVSANQLTLTINAAQIQTPGTVLIAVTSPGGGVSNSAPLTVTAANSPVATITPTALTFGPQGVGTTSASQIITVTNTGTATLNIASDGNTNPQNFGFTQTCGGPLSPGQSCSITVTFHPTTTGALSETITINDNAADSPQTIPVTGTGIQLTGSSVNFGDLAVGSTTGTPLQLVYQFAVNPLASFTPTLTLANGSEFTVGAPDCSTSGPTATCFVNATFNPLHVGLRQDVLSITSATGTLLATTRFNGTGLGGLLQVSPALIRTIAGNGTPGALGNGGPAIGAQLNGPDGIAFDRDGNLYIADTLNSVIRKVDTSGNISLFAGTGTAGYSGDGFPATAAQLNKPYGVAVDASGNVYIQDTKNNVVRKVDAAGTITTFAGNGLAGNKGDGGPAIQAELNDNQGARFDSAGQFYIPQCKSPAVRRIDLTGTITTVAGNGTSGFSGDGFPAINAQLACPSGAAVDAAGNLYIADYNNNRIRKVDTNGIIHTIAGTGTAGALGDGGPASAAQLNLPNDVALDTAGNLYIADSGNNRIRRIDPAGGISTVAGGPSSTAVPALNGPSALTFSNAGQLYLSDTGSNLVRTLAPIGTGVFPATTVGTAAAAQTFTLTNIGNVTIATPSQQNFTFTGDTGDFSIAGGTCLTALTLPANDGSCTLQIGFTPTAAGARSLAISFTDSALNSPQSIQVTGQGVALTPSIQLAGPSASTFGQTAQFTATLLNFTGSPVITFYDGALALGPANGAGGSFLTSTLSAGIHRITAQALNGSVNVTSNPVQVLISQATPVLTWATPAPINAGTALSGDQLNASAAGVGGAPLAGAFTYTPGAGFIPPAGNQTLSVLFTPQDTTDYTTANRSVVLVVNAADPIVSLSATSLAFGSLGVGSTSAAQQLTVLNTGNAPLTVTAAQLTGTNAADFSIAQNTCGTAAVAPAGTCTIGIQFAPTAIGARTAALSIADNAAGSPQTVTLSGTGVQQAATTLKLGAALVNTSSTRADLTLQFNGDIGTPTFTLHLGREYKLGAASCSFDTATVCKVPVTFSPAFPGLREDAIFATDPTSSAVIATALLYGSGLGPEAALDVAGFTSHTGFGVPGYLAVDQAGTLYLSDTGGSQVDRIAADGTPSVIPLTGLSSPSGLAVEGSGALYVADSKLNQILKYDAHQVQSTFALPGGLTLSSPQGLAVGPTGTLYIVDGNHNRALSVDSAGNLTVLATDLKSPRGIALDTAGNVYVADHDNRRIAVITTDGVESSIGSNLGITPVGVAVDPSGGVYITDDSTQSLVQIDSRGRLIGQSQTPASAIDGLALDSASNLFLSDRQQGLYYSYIRNTATLNFGNVFLTTSAINGAFLSNVGNQPLSLSAASIPSAYVLTPAGSLANQCPAFPSTLAAGSQCVLSVTFAPQAAGPADQTLVVSDNSLNLESQQDISLVGTGIPLPRITSLNPAQVLAGSPALTLTVNGANFTADAHITVNGTAQAATTFISATQLSTTLASAQLNAAGSLVVGVTEPGSQTSGSSNTVNFIVLPRPVPAITSINPAGTFAGSAATLVTVTGTGFVSGAQVTVNGAAQAATFVSATQLTTTLSAAQLAQAATLSLAVIEPGSTTSNAVPFSVVALPVISSVSPASVYAGSPATVLTVNGANFLSGAQVTINGVGQATTSFSSTQLKTTLSAAQLASPAVFTIGVVNPAIGSTAGGSSANNPAFPVLSGPVLTLISPSETAVSASSLPLVVSGSGFVSGSVVLANGTSLATTFVSATQLNATVPAALLAQAGALSIQVQNPVVSGAGGLSATLPLNVVPDLVLSSIAPATAVLNAAATTLTATGSHFTSTTVVQFNGSALATSFVSATRLTAVIPASDLTAAGSYRITTFDPASGSVSGAQSFAVLPNPTVVFTGPPTVEPGGQPPIVFRISESYPVAIDGLLTVSFTPDSGLPQDPMVLFSNNQQTLPFTLAAGSTATPPVLLQAGTTAGTITVSLSLSSGGVPVTQVAPILITVPRSVPNILSATLTRGTRQVTVTVTGYSSTRELTFGGFRFTPANGASFTQTDFALSVTPLFVSWYNDPASLGFGTEFTYTQTFNLSGSSAQIGSVAVTLSNSVGTSTPKTAQ